MKVKVIMKINGIMRLKEIMKIKRMNNSRKALVFSLATIFMVFAIFSFSRVFFTTSIEFNKISTDSFYGEQFRYFEEDIMNNLEVDLMNTTIHPIVRKGSTVILNFTQSLNDREEDIEQYFSNYKSYVEENYSSNNYQFNLTDFNSEFNITPYSARYHMDDGRLYIYTNDTDNLQNITVKVYTDQDLDGGRTSLPDDDGGDATFIPIFIYVYDSEQSLSNDTSSMTTREQNPTENNDPFQQTWKDTPNQDVTEVDVEYGTHNGVNGVLQVYVHNANSNYNILADAVVELNYNSEGPVEMIGGVLNTHSVIGNLTKKSRYVLKKE